MLIRLCGSEWHGLVWTSCDWPIFRNYISASSNHTPCRMSLSSAAKRGMQINFTDIFAHTHTLYKVPRIFLLIFIFVFNDNVQIFFNSPPHQICQSATLFKSSPPHSCAPMGPTWPQGHLGKAPFFSCYEEKYDAVAPQPYNTFRHSVTGSLLHIQ